MKKGLAFLLAVAMIFALVACGKPQNQPPASDPPVSESPTGPLAADHEWEQRRDKMTQEEADQAPDKFVSIETKLGAVKGVQKEGYREFRGIRYATAERWEEAVAVTTPWNGEYDATAWGDRCMQFKGIYGFADSVINQFYDDEALVTFPAGYSEDALNLNIWTPDNAKDCPVLLYIHGGAYMTGSNTDTSTDGEAYAEHGVITVAINYRLGPWSNIYGDGYEGNLALTDQLTAIRWVKENIADYGGDPSKITIMGESAGAMSVQNLLMSPLMEEGLVAGAIMMSGGGNLKQNDTPMNSAVMGVLWQQVKNAGGYSNLSELLGLSAQELFEVWALNLGELDSAAATPIMNGVSLVETVDSALKNGNIQNVPTMIGMLSEDMHPYTLYTAAVDYAKARSNAGGKPVYLYYFDRQQPGDNKFGAFHAADLYYAFGTLYRNWRPFNDIDYRISHNMIDYISNFVKTGDPNGAGLVKWEAATAESQQFMHFGDEEAAMITPDKSFLSDNQYTKPTFPYADKVKYPGVSGDGTVNNPEEGTPIDPEDLLGEWIITGWDVAADGSHVPVDYEAIFTFEETQRYYHVDGALNNVRDYYWKDETTIVIIMDGVEHECGVYWGRDGFMMLEDPRYGIIYTCYREGGNLPKPFYDDVTVVSSEAIKGTWDITGWIVKANGSFSGVSDQTFVFEDNLLSYYIGKDLASASTYYFEDRYNIGLRAQGASKEEEYGVLWTVYLNDKGQLLIEDPAYDIIYVCDLIEGTGSQEPEVELPDPFYSDAVKVSANGILGTWNITGWIVKADESFAAVEGQSFIFETNRLSYYIGEGMVSANAYYFEDDYNIGLRADGAAKEDPAALVWTVYLNDKGQLLIEDPSFDIIYVCELVEGTGYQEPEVVMPKPFYSDVVVASNDDIQGTWNITGWIVKADGSFAAVQDQTFVFETNKLSYCIGSAPVSISAYYFDDQYNIGLRAEGAAQSDAYGVLWTLYFNADGQLLIEDPSFDIIYVCESAGSQEPEPSAKPEDPYIGTWTVHGYSLDGTNATFTGVVGQKFIFTDGIVEYTIGGASAGVWNYTAEYSTDGQSDVTFNLTGAANDTWLFINQEDGSVLIYDAALFCFYHCTKDA